eukprot:m.94312 g.94312  ORF g.94312 m.94312 type:complete len:59 (+) comp13022_c1_seq1:125-301(+)
MLLLSCFLVVFPVALLLHNTVPLISRAACSNDNVPLTFTNHTILATLSVYRSTTTCST